MGTEKVTKSFGFKLSPVLFISTVTLADLRPQDGIHLCSLMCNTLGEISVDPKILSPSKLDASNVGDLVSHQGCQTFVLLVTWELGAQRQIDLWQLG